MDKASLNSVIFYRRWKPKGKKVLYDRQKYMFEIDLSDVKSKKELLTLLNQWGIQSDRYTLLPRDSNGRFSKDDKKIAIIIYKRPSVTHSSGYLVFEDNKCKLKKHFDAISDV